MTRRITPQAANDTRPYEVFMTLRPNTLRSQGLIKTNSTKAVCAFKARLADFIAKLPGFVGFHNGAYTEYNWLLQDDLGCLAIFANTMFAGAAILDIECEFGAIIDNHYPIYDASAQECFDAAVIAYRHTPSATHFTRLQTVMHELQAVRYPDHIER